MSDVVTIVLAAGRGARLGGPKALLAWPATMLPAKAPGGRETARAPGKAGGAGKKPVKAAPQDVPLAIAHAEQRLAAESARVLIVSRRAVINELLKYVRPGIDLLSSTAADDLGPAGSLQFAASRIGPTDVVLVTPVDTPPTKPETVAELLRRLGEGDPAPLAVRPRYQGRTGHPVILRSEALARYRSADPPPPLRDHLKDLGAAVVDVDVSDPAVLLDLDTAGEVMKVLGTMPRFMNAPKM
jgi:CTP:molybdopterin cytidylyltransferase MocA